MTDRARPHVIALIAAVIIVCFGCFIGFAAEAKQCVWNKAGFVLDVHWYKKSDMAVNANNQYFVLAANPAEVANGAAPIPRRPVQRDVFPVAQGRCWEGREQLVAVLAISGGEYVKPMLVTSYGIVTGALAAAIGGAACVLTAGIGCPLAAGGAAVATASGTAAVSVAIPDNKSINSIVPNAFAVVLPSQTHWLDVWGTVWSPQTGQGGRI